ncbi:HlyD family efflux transporter periplasmic adaptor subunit [Microbacterium sulfonylureivorans]|uniref:HlyD family efflux transporter periplasmic adaptor subunit n=1 Tax=Microbacterium sulfonylureivorans TaxID=2486854 RepID=UPI0013DFA857|nr:HlyD family efflux transporter periplasmic adaptor subunit [Microbacterium sulfonylureivorans]
MTWPNRIRLFFGLLVVLAIVAVCTIAFNQRQLRAESASASIVSQEYSVGSIYAGTVTEQLVRAGDTVKAGDTLFLVHSPLLARDLASESITESDLGVPVDPDGTLAVTSSVDGTVSEVFAPVGDFAQSGEVLAAIDRAQTLTVEAEFTLTSRDYGRMSDGTIVDLLLPDDRSIRGIVTEIDVETVDGLATSTVTIESAALKAQSLEGLYRPGTPVRATLHLRDDGPLSGVSDMLRDFREQVGL